MAYKINNIKEGCDINKLIDAAKSAYLNFIETCRHKEVDYSLTPSAEPTGYARCFAVFGLHLLKQNDVLDKLRQKLIISLRNEVRSVRKNYNDSPVNKEYRQLLTFSLSALSILKALDEDPMSELVIEQLPENIDEALRSVGALDGKPQSGNQAMFLAIFLIYAGEHLGIDVESRIARWVELHLKHMNRFGFWGNSVGMRHLLFQNGYHQYEILEYLGVENVQIDDAVKAVYSLVDPIGHFAPYPGGGGCYDYDAVFILTQSETVFDVIPKTLFQRIITTLLEEQTNEGGWGESHYVRPRNFRKLGQFISHTINALPNISLFFERLRYAITLQRPCHDRINTHWSQYSRSWGEADLWDSWFRMMTIARLQIAEDHQKAKEWGFIDFPGIGYHPLWQR